MVHMRDEALLFMKLQNRRWKEEWNGSLERKDVCHSMTF